MMATAKNIKAMIASVRTVVANYSNDEIVLVLEHNDYNVDLTISDFLEGQANDILTEWQHTGSLKMTKAKKKKKSQKKKQNDSANSTSQENAIEKNLTADANGHQHDEVTVNDPDTAAVALKHLLINPADTDATSPLNRSLLSSASPSGNDTANSSTNDLSASTRRQRNDAAETAASRRRTRSDSGPKEKWSAKTHKRTSGNNSNSGQPDYSSSQLKRNQNQHSTGGNVKSIEKSSRDLQRCAVSFGRYRNLLNEDIDSSYKRIKKIFEELTNALMDREVQLMRMIDLKKDETLRLLHRREQRAAELRRRTERVAGMTPQQVNTLRTDIKHFVADRKSDEELSRAIRFDYDRNVLVKVIPNFGEISSNKNSSSSVHPGDGNESVASDLSLPSLADEPSPAPHLPSDLPALPADAEKSETSTSAVPDEAKGTENWADAIDSQPLPDSRASWASEVPVISGIDAKKQTHQADQPPRNQQAKSSGYDNLPSSSRHSNSARFRSGGSSDRGAQERGFGRSGMRDPPRLSDTHVASGDAHRNFSNGRYKNGFNGGGYHRNDRMGSYRGGANDFYRSNYHYNGDAYQHRSFRGPEMGYNGPPRNRARNYRNYSSNAPRNNYHTRKVNGQQTSETKETLNDQSDPVEMQ